MLAAGVLNGLKSHGETSQQADKGGEGYEKMMLLMLNDIIVLTIWSKNNSNLVLIFCMNLIFLIFFTDAIIILITMIKNNPKHQSLPAKKLVHFLAIYALLVYKTASMTAHYPAGL